MPVFFCLLNAFFPAAFCCFTKAAYHLRYLLYLELDFRDNDGNDMTHYERLNWNQIKSKNSQSLPNMLEVRLCRCFHHVEFDKNVSWWHYNGYLSLCRNIMLRSYLFCEWQSSSASIAAGEPLWRVVSLITCLFSVIPAHFDIYMKAS